MGKFCQHLRPNQLNRFTLLILEYLSWTPWVLSVHTFAHDAKICANMILVVEAKGYIFEQRDVWRFFRKAGHATRPKHTTGVSHRCWYLTHWCWNKTAMLQRHVQINFWQNTIQFMFCYWYLTEVYSSLSIWKQIGWDSRSRHELVPWRIHAPDHTPLKLFPIIWLSKLFCIFPQTRDSTWASYQIRKIAGCACAKNAGNVSPPTDFKVSDPGMHHGMYVTHVPWCMSGSLTRGSTENVSGIPGACATRNFTNLLRSP